jgi:hypothetical protein
MMIFLALYSRAQLLLTQREKKPNEKQSNECVVVWREDRETFPENGAFRMKDTHTHTTTTTTPNRFRIKSQRRGKMFDEFFPQTKKSQTHSVVSRTNEEPHERPSETFSSIARCARTNG